MIMGQSTVMIASQLLGLEIQDLVVPLTHKETVSFDTSELLEILSKAKFILMRVTCRMSSENNF